jgi:hypothetical protein
MSNLRFYVDTDRIADQFGSLKEEVKNDLTKSVENLANMTHARTLELAGEELTSLQKKYKENVEFSNPAPNFWVVTLKEPAMWIEEGRKAGFMEELLNGKSSRTGKNGKYAIIPFEHNKNPSEQSAKAYDLAKEIQYGLKKKGVSWKKIEKDEDGSPRLGRLHAFNLETARPLAQKDTHKGSLTAGVAVYQNVYDQQGQRVQNKDRARHLLSKGMGTVKKDVMTFRIISEKSRNEGAWIHPGRPGNKIMDKAFEWAMQTWEREILPAVFEKYNGK